MIRLQRGPLEVVDIVPRHWRSKKAKKFKSTADASQFLRELVYESGSAYLVRDLMARTCRVSDLTQLSDWRLIERLAREVTYGELKVVISERKSPMPPEKPKPPKPDPIHVKPVKPPVLPPLPHLPHIPEINIKLQIDVLDIASMLGIPLAEICDKVNQAIGEVNNTLDEVKDDINEVADELENVVDTVAKDITDTVDEVAKEVTDTVDEIAKDVENAVDEIAKDVENVIDEVAQDIKDAVDELIEEMETCDELELDEGEQGCDEMHQDEDVTNVCDDPLLDVDDDTDVCDEQNADDPPAPPHEEDQTYVVHKGDSLSAISIKFYGEYDLWYLIWKTNKDVIGNNWNLIYPGQELTIRPLSAFSQAEIDEARAMAPKWKNPPTGGDSSDTGDSSNTSGSDSGSSSGDQGQQYTVKKGDSLSAISKKFYGEYDLWYLIWKTNKDVIGNNWNLIYPGQELTIRPLSAFSQDEIDEAKAEAPNWKHPPSDS